MNRKTKSFFKMIIGVIIIFSSIVIFYYPKIYSKNVISDTAIFIPSDISMDSLVKIVKPHLKNISYFEQMANIKRYSKNIKSGKYLLIKGMNSNELVNLLRSGAQTPIKLRFNNQHQLESLAAKISRQIEADSISLLRAFKDSIFLEKKGFNKQTAIGMYIPNSYEFYWNTNAEEFRNIMFREYISFWDSTRVSKAKQQGLSTEEVIALASIVQKETYNLRERPIVAGLYLNRIHKNWPLQADPTIMFALKEKYGQYMNVKRILNADLKIDSPYNTYENKGLPPGPISMPDISSIDAVLNPVRHDYLYMCASIEKKGTHVFAKNLKQHRINARKYQKWLSKEGIRR